MSKKSFNESRENKNYVNSDGLKQRRLKEEHRWRFNTNYVEDAEDDYEDFEEDQEFRGYN